MCVCVYAQRFANVANVLQGTNATWGQRWWKCQESLTHTQSALQRVKLSPPEETNYTIICVTPSCFWACDYLIAACSIVIFCLFFFSMSSVCCHPSDPNRSEISFSLPFLFFFTNIYWYKWLFLRFFVLWQHHKTELPAGFYFYIQSNNK